jgi:hypothetical protein
VARLEVRCAAEAGRRAGGWGIVKVVLIRLLGGSKGSGMTGCGLDSVRPSGMVDGFQQQREACYERKGAT